MITRVWSRLETYQAATPKNRYASVLQLRRDYPKASIDEIAEKLGEITGPPVSPRRFERTSSAPAPSSSNCSSWSCARRSIPPAHEDIEAEIYDLGLGYLYRRYTNPAEN